MFASTLTKAIAGTAVAGCLTLGVGTAAFADSAPPAPTTATTAKGCKTADVRVDRLQKREVKVEARIATLEKRVDVARAKRHDDRVQKLNERIARVKTVRDALKDRVAKIRQRCSVTVAPLGSTTAQAPAPTPAS